jgi:hypothetical protein
MQSFMIDWRKVENPKRNRNEVRKVLNTSSVVQTVLIYTLRPLILRQFLYHMHCSGIRFVFHTTDVMFLRCFSCVDGSFNPLICVFVYFLTEHLKRFFPVKSRTPKR